MMRRLFLLFLLLTLGACTPAISARPAQPPATAVPATRLVNQIAAATPSALPATAAVATSVAPVALTPVPTSSSTPTSTPTPTPTFTPSPTPIGLCTARIPGDDDLGLVVSQTYGLSRDYEPGDLVMLDEYLDRSLTLGYPTQVRAILVEPLREMIADMQSAGLAPFVISGYRSYAQQATAFQKWQNYNPAYATILSARPGFSEHQLGTTVDFGSPELPAVVGDPDIEFHTLFYQTSEGQWLLANAHRYGFTLSFTREAAEVTGFFYEPWHYRYVGIELATLLHDEGVTLTEYRLATDGAPCIP